MQKHSYKLKPDVRKITDKMFRDYFKAQPLPQSIDLRCKMQPIYNQGQLGSCQSHAADAIDAYIKGYSFTPSHLFTYYNVRTIEGTVDEDGGGTLSDTCDALKKYGTCDSLLWAYDISKFKDKPPETAYANATMDKDSLTDYYRVETIDEAKQALAAGHLPLIGVKIYENFETADCMSTGIVPSPKGTIEGGHALVIVAYCDVTPKKSCLLDKLMGKTASKGYFIIRNSWGTGIGLNGSGYFQCSYEVFEKLITDMWIIVE
jgi:C1A family cysteine protease